MTKKEPRIAIVTDWLTNMGGAEKVVIAAHEAFKDAPIYTSTFSKEAMPEFAKLDVRTTWLQKLPPRLGKLHKLFPILRVKAFQDLDLSDYDVILCFSSAESKQVIKTRPNQVLICYCHTPIRYYWSHYKEYKKDPGFNKFLNPIIRLLMPVLIPPMRQLDYKAAQKVDTFIANSTEVQNRIKKYYNQPSTIIYPPVDTKLYQPSKTRADYYVIVSRQIPYKKVDLAIKAALKLNINLRVYGKGSEHDNLVKLANHNSKIEFFTDRFSNASDEAIRKSLEKAKGFIFPGYEDFGIVMVEALAAGTPVISYNKGGARDIITDQETGVLFNDQTVDSLVGAIKKADGIKFNPLVLKQRAKRFDKVLFINKLQKVVSDSYLNHRPN